MRWITMTLSAFALLLALASAPAFAGGEKVYEIEVSGLACPFCAYGLEKELKATEGVKDAQVDLVKGLCTVTVDEEVVFDRAAAERAVTDAGFTLESFEEVPATITR